MSYFNDLEIKEFQFIPLTDAAGKPRTLYVCDPELTIFDWLDGVSDDHQADTDKLALVEAWAAYENIPSGSLIESESELSEQFDAEVLPLIKQHCDSSGLVWPDYPMIREEFNNWTDSLCRDGQLHEEQYNNYCYVGEYQE